MASIHDANMMMDGSGSGWLSAYNGGDYGSFSTVPGGGGAPPGMIDVDHVAATYQSQASAQSQEQAILHTMNMQQAPPPPPQSQSLASIMASMSAPPPAYAGPGVNGGGGGGGWAPTAPPASQYTPQQQAAIAAAYRAAAVPQPTYLEILWQRRRDVARLVVLSLVVLLAISAHGACSHYLKTFIEEHAIEMTFWKELGVRLAYPVVVLIVLWHMKAFAIKA
jgi:hypothetical protein